MTETLKPCPFCGKDCACTSYSDARDSWFIPFCVGQLDDCRTEAEATAAWNRRAELAAHGDVEALDKIERLAEMISEHGTDDIAASAARDISYAVATLRTRTVGEGST